MYQSIDCYSPDPGGQGTFYGSLWFSLFAFVKAYLQLTFRGSLEKKSKEQFLFYRFTKLLKFSGFTDKSFMMKSLRWDVHCNAGSLGKHNQSVLCSMLLSNIYVTIKACSRNITSSTNLAYREKVNLQVPVRLSIQGHSLFPGKEKSSKCNYIASGCCFIHHPLISAILH